MINGAVSMGVFFIYLIYEFWKKLDYFALFLVLLFPKAYFAWSRKIHINQALWFLA